MVTFIDTSALISLFDENDEHHLAAAATWRELMDEHAVLRSTDYVRLETWSLLQARFGLRAVQIFDHAYLPVIAWQHVGEQQFAAAKTRVLASGRRGFSLVDAASFTLMKDENIQTAFAFDRHFHEEGFKLL